MSPIFGNAIVLLAVAALVVACARFLWKDAQRGGCGGCAGCGRGDCAQCSACTGSKSQLRIDPDRLRDLRIKKE